MNEILVSILCITYNHEKYISMAIESFLMQETNFNYEILVHDDASTDKTAEIIRSFEKDFPDIIKPIYQSENQYSKGIRVGQLNMQRAKGKYFALCEGDDYWTDRNKLQVQVDYMESHSECALCFHAGKTVNTINNRIKMIRPYKQNQICKVEDIILGEGTNYCLTNSMLFPSKFGNENIPFIGDLAVGDYPRRLYLATKGTVYYIDRCMSVYRSRVIGSWVTTRSEEIERGKYKKFTEFYHSLDHMMCLFDEYSKFKYTKTIQIKRIINDAKYLRSTQRYDELKQKRFKPYWDYLGVKGMLKYAIERFFPNLFKLLKRI